MGATDGGRRACCLCVSCNNSNAISCLFLLPFLSIVAGKFSGGKRSKVVAMEFGMFVLARSLTQSSMVSKSIIVAGPTEL